MTEAALRTKDGTEIMRFLLAAYDPAQGSPDGCYWCWWHPELPKGLLNTFYYEVAAENLPKEPNKLLPADYFGGWAAIDNVWTCWYRFFNGGRDLRGRPGRYVLVCAFCDRTYGIAIDASSLLNSQAFQPLVADAMCSKPLPPPESFDLELSPPEIPLSERGSPLRRSTEFRGLEGRKDAVLECAKLPSDRQFHCKFDDRDGRVMTVLEIRPTISAPILSERCTEFTSPKVPMSGRSNSGPEELLLSRQGATNNRGRRPPMLQMIFPFLRRWGVVGVTCLLCATGAFLAGYYLGRRPSGPLPMVQPSTRPAENHGGAANEEKRPTSQTVRPMPDR